MLRIFIFCTIFAASLTACDSHGTGVLLPKWDIECYSSDGSVIYSAVNVGPLYSSSAYFEFADNDGHSVRISGQCLATETER